MATMVGMEQAFELAVEEFISQRMDDIFAKDLCLKRCGKESEYSELFKKESNLNRVLEDTLDDTQNHILFLLDNIISDKEGIALRSAYRCGAMDAFAIFRLFLEGGKDGEKK